jgi:predicted ATPase
MVTLELVSLSSPSCCSHSHFPLHSFKGKTSLINEIHKPLVRDKGYFISGKLDQFCNDSASNVFVQSLRELIQQLLAEDEEQLLDWKKKILDSLGSTGKVMTDIIPELELIIGPQSELTVLGPTENETRFNNTFLKFLSVFTQGNRPLVIFLDDLQWVGLPTLRLVETVLSSEELKSVLLLGAYRDNEVDSTSPLSHTIERLYKKKKLIDIRLEPLNNESIINLLQDTLGAGSDWSYLADILKKKTEGNPFYLSTLLSSMKQEGILKFDHSNGSWKVGVNSPLFSSSSDSSRDSLILTVSLLIVRFDKN